MPRHVVFLESTPLAQLLCDRFEMRMASRKGIESMLEGTGGLVGTFMQHNPEWKTRGPLVFEKLSEWVTEGVSLVVEGMLENPEDVDLLASAMGTEAQVAVVCFSPNDLVDTLTPGGFVHCVTPTDDIENDFKTLVNLLGDDSRFGTFARFNVPESVLWSGTRANHPLEAFAEPVRPLAAAEVIQRVLELAESKRMYKQFCGTHPVSLDRDNYESLIKHPYALSLKRDGVRYFLLVKDNRLFFINRACDVWGGPRNHRLDRFDGSLLDCEFAASTLVIIDVLAVGGKCIRNFFLRRRLDEGKELVDFLRVSGRHIGFSTTYQQYVDLYRPEASSLVRSTRFTTIDGFVFTPLRMPYIMGRCYHLLKWKPNNKNTVDLLFERPNRVSCVDEEGLKIECGEVTGVPGKTESGEIIECRIGNSDQEWNYERTRPDKDAPNVEWVLERIVDAVRQNITQTDILKWMDESSHYRSRNRRMRPNGK